MSSTQFNPSSDVASLVHTIVDDPRYSGIFRAIGQRCTEEVEAYVGFPHYRSRINEGIFCVTREGFCVLDVTSPNSIRLRDLTADDLATLDAESVHTMANEARDRVMSGRLGRTRRAIH